MTRPESLKTPFTKEEILKSLNKWIKIFSVCDEYQKNTVNLMQLIEDYDLKGKRIHDANIVATMMTYGIKKIFTFNKADFKSFKEVEIIK